MAGLKLELKRDQQVILAQDLAAGSYAIGGDLGCDIILPDVSEPLLATLDVEVVGNRFVASMQVEANGLTVNDEIVDAGRVFPEQRSLRFAYGAFEFSVIGEKVRAEGETKSGGLSVTNWLFGAALLVAAAAGAVQLTSGKTTAPVVPRVINPVQPPNPDEVRAKDLFATLTRRIAAADLAEKVKLRQQGTFVTATGTLSEFEYLRWRELTASLATADLGLLKSSIDLEPFGQDLVAGFGWSPQAYVVTKQGQRYREGDTLPSGWKIDSITRQGIRLRKDDTSFDLGL